ncbi:TPA: hypothetical protein KD105_004694 [Vibrio parahaemolyticus]|nr:hypothetical protein [Vibrio parahaemolyticus]HBC3607329.1 hypothetical protein [Vibrio parahaemolyticus]
MTFSEFEEWIKQNKWTSYILIFLFIFGVLLQFTDLYEKIEMYIFPKTFSVESLESSTKFSVYRDINKVQDGFRKYYKPTQFSESYAPEGRIDEYKSYRQFNYYTGLVDKLTNKTAITELFAVANVNINFALKSGGLTEEVHSRFGELSDCPKKMKETMNLVYDIVPPSRYRYTNLGGKSILEPFSQNDDEIASSFLKSLSVLYEDDLSISYKYCNKSINRGLLEELLQDYYPIFFNYFLPVFEITLANETSADIAIDAIAVQVINIAEYKGGSEYFNETKIITISVPYKKGIHKKVLKKKLKIPAKSKLIVKVRLEPQDRFSSYLMSINFYSGSVIKKTEVFAVDF